MHSSDIVKQGTLGRTTSYIRQLLNSAVKTKKKKTPI